MEHEGHWDDTDEEEIYCEGCDNKLEDCICQEDY
mgnify:CR=1 FL=1